MDEWRLRKTQWSRRDDGEEERFLTREAVAKGSFPSLWYVPSLVSGTEIPGSDIKPLNALHQACVVDPFSCTQLRKGHRLAFRLEATSKMQDVPNDHLKNHRNTFTGWTMNLQSSIRAR